MTISIITAITLSLILLLSITALTSVSISFAAQTNQTSSLQQQQAQSCKLTESNIEGPYYKEGAPFKQVLREGLKEEGERLILSGKVLNVRCEPVEGAVLDFWQADSNGNYDNEGFTLRGKVKTDKDGKYLLDTIIPKEYGQGIAIRPSHIHVKVGIPGQSILTTQLYFEGDAYNESDLFIKDSLIMKVVEENGTKKANFNFVIEDQ
jgi:protocatechuate 3,4-dioxygenase beta subunit